ncbi:MAG: DNA repair protein RecN [Fibrobacter sp.]|nr:DNA repair protein RecN [Fibrobacter sp.]
MLKQLSINGFTLIAKQEVPFHEGFTAITGETGAGKSVLMKALRLICGDRGQTSMVRTGEEKAVIEGTFDLKNLPRVKELLASLEIDSDDELIIRREILENGKGRARVNGAIVGLSDLEKIGDLLIQMHGQSEQLLLRDIKTHTQMLDDYAGNAKLLKDYSTLWDEWNSIKSEIRETESRAKDLAAQKDFLKFQFDELSKASLKPGEEEELEEKVRRGSKGEIEQNYLMEIQGLIGNDNGLLDQTQSLLSKLKSLSQKVPRYEEELNAFLEVSDPFQSICKDLMHRTPEKSLSEAELDKANGRIAEIQKLKRKYHTDVPGLLELVERRKQELSCIENLDSDLDELNKKLKICNEKLEKAACELSDKRKVAASTFDKAVESNLQSLGMPKAVFKTKIEEQPLAPNGKDRIEFQLAPNPGEGQKSLQKAVSGGELSRVLLSIKTVMAELDAVPLLIFDEVDSGISGEVGNRIGEALRNLGKHHQVLTITHLHQVASRANHQLSVSKAETDGRTFTSVRDLDFEGRIDELVRMLGENSDITREHARQLLENNR